MNRYFLNCLLNWDRKRLTKKIRAKQNEKCSLTTLNKPNIRSVIPLKMTYEHTKAEQTSCQCTIRLKKQQQKCISYITAMRCLQKILYHQY